ncbi:hypothetical protein [Xanthomonas citri]|nr:hypothetical protein [Xanthomonas citri]
MRLVGDGVMLRKEVAVDHIHAPAPGGLEADDVHVGADLVQTIFRQ